MNTASKKSLVSIYKNKRFRLSARYCFLLAGLLYIYSILDANAFANLLSIKISYLLGAVAIAFLVFCIKAHRWLILTKDLGLPPETNGYRTYLRSFFYGLISPGRSGELSRMVGTESSASKIARFLILERLIDVAFLTIIALVAWELPYAALSLLALSIYCLRYLQLRTGYFAVLSMFISLGSYASIYVCSYSIELSRNIFTIFKMNYISAISGLVPVSFYGIGVRDFFLQSFLKGEDYTQQHLASFGVLIIIFLLSYTVVVGLVSLLVDLYYDFRSRSRV